MTGVGVLRLLEAIRETQDNLGQKIKFIRRQVRKCLAPRRRRNRCTRRFIPRSPYACAKVYGFWQTVNHRESYDMFACNGILFNHESPRRATISSRRKITLAVGRIKHGFAKRVAPGKFGRQARLGPRARLRRGDVCDDAASDRARLRCGNGRSLLVREFAEKAFALANLDWEKYVVVDPAFFRPAEVEYLLGDPTDTFSELNWHPKVSFDELVKEMVEADMELARREKIIAEMGGHAAPDVSQSHPIGASL